MSLGYHSVQVAQICCDDNGFGGPAEATARAESIGLREAHIGWHQGDPGRLAGLSARLLPSFQVTLIPDLRNDCPSQIDAMPVSSSCFICLRIRMRIAVRMDCGRGRRFRALHTDLNSKNSLQFLPPTSFLAMWPRIAPIDTKGNAKDNFGRSEPFIPAYE